MAPNLIVLGRKMLVWLVAIGFAVSVYADAGAAVVGGRYGEAMVYVVAATFLLFLGISIESVKLFVEE